MENKERDFKGVWIPKEIWLNKDLSLTEKCLLVEIDSLDNDEKGCFASNEYFADFFDLKEGSMANIISNLKKRDYVFQVFFDGRNRGLRVNKNMYSPTSNESSLHKKMKADPIKKLKQRSQKNEHNNIYNNTNNNNSLSVPDDTSPSKQEGVKKEDSSAGLTKLVKSKFHTLVQKFGIDYHYPKSDAAWGIIHKGIKNVLIKEVCDHKLSIEENEKRLNDYFNRIYVMANKRVFPFETPEKIDFTNICSATIVAKVLNYHIETSKIVYDGVVFNVTRTDANGVKYDGDLAVTAQGGVKFDLAKSMYDYQDPKDANNFSKLKNAIKNGRT